MLAKNCIVCKKIFYKNPSVSLKRWNGEDPKRSAINCCSKECGFISRRGNPSWNKGLTAQQDKRVATQALHRSGVQRSPEAIERIKHGVQKAIRYGEHNPHWRGEKAGYHAIHDWVRKKYPKTGTCEICLQERKTQWASNSKKKFLRTRDGWRELCSSCHKYIDNGKLPSWEITLIWK